MIDHTPTTIRILLNYRNWDKENLYELYYCDSDLSKFFKAAGLMDPNIQLPVVQALPSECEICCSDLPIEVIHLKFVIFFLSTDPYYILG